MVENKNSFSWCYNHPYKWSYSISPYLGIYIGVTVLALVGIASSDTDTPQFTAQPNGALAPGCRRPS